MNDGVALACFFRSATDRGAGTQKLSSVFNCSLILQFERDYLANCQWGADALTLVIYPDPLSSLMPGSPISLKPIVIKSACVSPPGMKTSNCSSWSYADSKIVLINPPEYPVVPLVGVTAPSVIGACDSLVSSDVLKVNILS